MSRCVALDRREGHYRGREGKKRKEERKQEDDSHLPKLRRGKKGRRRKSERNTEDQRITLTDVLEGGAARGTLEAVSVQTLILYAHEHSAETQSCCQSGVACLHPCTHLYPPTHTMSPLYPRGCGVRTITTPGETKYPPKFVYIYPHERLYPLKLHIRASFYIRLHTRTSFLYS